MVARAAPNKRGQRIGNQQAGAGGDDHVPEGLEKQFGVKRVGKEADSSES
jgi:hypothetical protein